MSLMLFEKKNIRDRQLMTLMTIMNHINDEINEINNKTN